MKSHLDAALFRVGKCEFSSQLKRLIILPALDMLQ